MVKGPTHTNVIFDLVIPYGKDYEPEKIVKDLKQKIKDEMQGKHYAVIRVDRFWFVGRLTRMWQKMKGLKQAPICQIAVISLCVAFYSLGYVRGKHDAKIEK